MEIYIVITKNQEVYHEDLAHESFESRISALDFAVSSANRADTSLHAILKLDTATKTITEYELQLVEGRFELQKI